MPVRKPWDHRIDLKQDFQPKKGRLIPLSVNEQKEVEVFLDDQLAKGYIRPSISPQMSPVFFVPKKDGKKCMVQDYCYVNEFMIKNNYPLLLILQLVDKLKGCKLFTKMDLHWGYNNVRVKEGNEWKAAFVMHKGAFCYNRFPSLVGTENRGGSEVKEILTTAYREFGGCAHRCMGKPKRREQDRAGPRRRGRARSGTAEG